MGLGERKPEYDPAKRVDGVTAEEMEELFPGRGPAQPLPVLSNESKRIIVEQENAALRRQMGQK